MNQHKYFIFKTFLFRCSVLLLFIAVTGFGQTDGKKDIILNTMQEELSRSMTELSKTNDKAPYYIGYRIVETNTINISAAFGALTYSMMNQSRYLTVNVHVGNYQLDNSHPLRNDYSNNFPGLVNISLDNDPDAIKSVLWQETDRKYKEAIERLAKVQSDKAIKTTEENLSDDFSQEKPLSFSNDPINVYVNKSEWEKRIKNLSASLKDYPFILNSGVSLQVQSITKYIVNSEGSKIKYSQNYIRLGINLSARADDGMELRQYESYDASKLEGLPNDEVVLARIKEMADILGKMRTAPLVEPYTGPAILSGKASGVFFHEIFGHRIEGHRQKDEQGGQTFAKKVGEKILPEFISVYDDPTVRNANNIELNGYYQVDDEGIAAQKVNVVENGILKDFLMSRSPFKNFKKSNGHGRAQEYMNPVSRQGNLIIKPATTVPYTKLREMLIEECKKQGRPFGLIFQEIEGGFTMIGRVAPNAFNVRPILVYKVYLDGKPDEMVRGVDLIGTPLTPFSKILAAGDDVSVFNGYCGAESGSVPVSAVSPSILVGEIEVQKKEKSTTKPPILQPPSNDK